MGGGGATTFLTKLTTGLAITYMVFVVVLGKLATRAFAEVGEPEQASQAISLPLADDPAAGDTDTSGDTSGE